MEKLKKRVEAVIREVYGFDERIIITDIDVKFNVATGNLNGAAPIAATPIFPQVTQRRKYTPKRKVSTKPKMSMHREFTTTAEDIHVMRHFLGQWRKEGLLGGEQETFFAQTTGTYYRLMSQETKSRMREIFEEVRTKVLSNRLGGKATASV